LIAIISTVESESLGGAANRFKISGCEAGQAARDLSNLQGRLQPHVSQIRG
jgi:hypothetical protein